MARKFLYGVVVLIVLVIAAAVVYSLFGNQLIRTALVPSAAFTAEPRAARNAYDARRMWIARPDIAGNPALWTPAGYSPAPHPAAAVFFIHPTSYIGRDHWNAALDDADTNARAALFLRAQASAFNEAGAIWAPRYRQATFGAFLTSRADAEKALALAYGDVSDAFDAFLKQVGPTRPIILAGHSQGALHLERLLRDRVAGTPLAKRIVAAYVVGWPISRATDLPRLGLPECTSADQAGCILSWQSFAEPADPSLIVDTYDTTRGFTGAPRKGTHMVCTNPLTGTPDAAAPAAANKGTLFPVADLSSASIVGGRVPARCDGQGFPAHRRAAAAAQLCAARQQLSRLRLQPVLGQRPRRCRAAPGSVPGAVITTDRGAFRGVLPSGGRLLGLDVGTKTIGTALCDAGWSFASPATLIRRRKFTQDKAAIGQFALEQLVAGLVIGLPLNLDGSESPRSQSTRAFARNCADLGYPILLWDERWSTQAVTRTLIEQDYSRAKRAGMVDNHAAAHILQGAIDALVAATR